MNKMNFIKTQDSSIAEELRKNGFKELAKEGQLFCFINNGKMNFAKTDLDKISYTNVLCM